MAKPIVTLLLLLTATTLWAQIDKTDYRLIYSSESPEAAKSDTLEFTEEELANCTSDFMSKENMERHWEYSPRRTSTWNCRMGRTDEERNMVHKCEDGVLKLLAKAKDGISVDSVITSGVNMKQGYRYGIYEIKATCHTHASNFPAIWMMPVDQSLGWPDCGETDIMEQIGTSSYVHCTVHPGARYDQSVGKSYTWTGNKWFTADVEHIYSLLWLPESLTFYCDGVQVFQYMKDTTLDLENHPEYEHAQFPYNKPFYIILDQAVGENQWWGPEDPDPSYTYEMDVEYVRIFQTEKQMGIEHINKVYETKNNSKVALNNQVLIKQGNKQFTLTGQRTQ